MPSSSLHSTYGHTFSVIRIADTARENQCSKLLHLETGRRLLSLLLICVFLVFLMKCCNRSSLKPAIWLRIARPMCDGRLFRLTASSPLGGSRGPFCRGFPFRWAPQFALSLARCLTLQDAALCYRKDSLCECGRPHDTLSCLSFTALWLRQGRSVLTQVQQTNDIDLTCYKTMPTKSVTCLQVGPMSLVWLDQSSLSPSHEDANDEHPEDALPAPPHSCWRRDALQPPQIQRGSPNRKTCVHVPDNGLRCVTWNARGLIGSPTSSQISSDSRVIERNNFHLPSRGTWKG